MSEGLIRPRVVEAGDSVLLAELPARFDPMTSAAVLRLASHVQGAGLRGVLDVVPSIRSLAVFFDPLRADVEALKRILSLPLEPDMALEGPLHEIPVAYGGEAGPDVADVARLSGLTEREVVARHAGRDYRVYMLGFLPGFAYLGTLDPSLVAPRRDRPRLRVAAGSVGAAGRQTGVYPRESPGGWALLGRTGVPMFNPAESKPALLAPGDRVRFRETARQEWSPPVPGAWKNQFPPSLEVVRAGLFTTIQDRGRWGHQRDGVSIAGAMDFVSHRVANAVVGNEASAATLEITVSGPQLRVLRACVLAVSGADLGLEVNGQIAARDTAIHLQGGAVVSFRGRVSGARAYLALAGGIDVPVVLGSRSTHTPSGLGGPGGRVIAAGDLLAVAPRGPVSRPGRAAPLFDTHAGDVTLRLLPGPQAGAFPGDALRKLTFSRWIVSSEANRMGYRLEGASVPAPAGEMISDVTIPGALQVPPSGAPILLMADRQTTGGYPQLAIVIAADLPRAAQLAPGDGVRFEMTTPREALASLAAQERAVHHFVGHAFS